MRTPELSESWRHLTDAITPVITLDPEPMIVPCWVREMEDDEAYMALALNNMQGELHPLEVGLHAKNSGLSIREYAKQTGMKLGILQPRIEAANVQTACNDIITRDLRERWSHLSEIHAAPTWLWSALVTALQAESWTVEATRKAVQNVSEAPEPPPWANQQRIAEQLIARTLQPKAIAKITELVEETKEGLTDQDLIEQLTKLLEKRKPSQLSAVHECCNSDGAVTEEGEVLPLVNTSIFPLTL